MKRSPQSRFITFEGVEGSGKSSNVAWAADYLARKGIKVLITHEPGRTNIGEELRHVLLRTREDRLMPMTELFLMFASRTQLLEEVVRPALARGEWVLCDRYADSSIAYQGGGRELGVPSVKTVIEAMGDRYIEPDLTFLFDLPAEIIPERLAGHTLDRFESEDRAFFERVRATYLNLAKEADRFHVVDATQSLSAIQDDLRARLEAIVDEVASR